MYKGARCVNMIAKPPKPPCWRDFVCDSDDSEATGQLCFTDLSKLQKSGLQVVPGIGDGTSVTEVSSEVVGPNNGQSSTRPRRHGKRLRAKLHRTRSQALIQEEDLPNGSLTVNLSETKPREFGLNSERRHIHICDNRRYMEENAKRCQTWLATVEASQPLDDIAFAQGSGVDIEIPEECWDSRADVIRPPNNSSASGSEEEDVVPEMELSCRAEVHHVTNIEKYEAIPDNEISQNSCNAKISIISNQAVNRSKLKKSPVSLRSIYCDLGECRSSLT